MRDSYHDDTSTVGKTMLQLYCDSPYEYYLRYLTGELPHPCASSDMELGTIIHRLVLEKHKIDDIILVYPAECYTAAKTPTLDWRKAAAFRAANPTKICVKSPVCDTILAIFTAVCNSPLYDLVQDATEREQAHYATVYGVDAKCKPDFASKSSVFDLKLSSPVPSNWHRSAKRFRYWLQDAHYSCVLEAEGHEPRPFVFWVVESTPPYRIKSYWYDDRSRALAREYHCRKMTELFESYRDNNWDDNWPQEMHLSDWEVGFEDVQLVGFDDDE